MDEKRIITGLILLFYSTVCCHAQYGYGTNYGTSSYGTGYGTNYGTGYGTSYGTTGYGSNYGTGYGTTGYGTGYGANNLYGNAYDTTGYYGGTSGFGSSAYVQSCPYGTSPYNYLGTSAPLSCLVGINQCPGMSTCKCSSSYCPTYTSGVCCTNGLVGNLVGYQQTEQTGDPYCPTAVLGVTCSGIGSATCLQYGDQFVCQYSFSRQQYRCCM